MSFFMWLENSAGSMWIKEAGLGWPYDLILSAHAIGMAFVVGVSAGIALRVMGYAPSIPLASLKGFMPFVYGGFWVNAASGLALAVAYPTKAVSNPMFYLKMAGVAAAIVCIRAMTRRVFDPAAPGAEVASGGARRLAGALLVIWTITISAGRLLAYHSMDPTIERQTPVAILVVTAVIVLVAYAERRISRGGGAGNGMQARPSRGNV
jgi:hypothetical protein